MRILLALVYTLVSLALAHPIFTPIETRTIDEIYEAALKENGTLHVAWGGDIKASQDGIQKAFRKRFPGVPLNLTVGLSKYWHSRIDRTYSLTNGEDNLVDVAVLQDLHAFPQWKREGRLLPYKVAPWNDLYPQFVDKHGFFTGCYIFMFGEIVYRSDIPSSTVPTTYEGFLDPQWKDKLTLTYPNDDDAILYLFRLIVRKYGWGFLTKLLRQNINWVRGTATPSIRISHPTTGNDNSTSNPLSASFASSKAFATGIESKTPDDVYMAWPQTGAIFENTKLPETSKLFMSFLLDDQWQKMIGSSGFATRRSFDRKGVFKQPHMDPLGYGKFMQDRQQVEAWRFQFESTIGLPQGEDPVYLTF